MWIVYALSAAIIWGISYSASGRIIQKGMTPLVFFFFYALLSMLVAGGSLLAMGKIGALHDEVKSLGPDWKWLVVALLASAAGGLLIYIAIGEKNATLASLIEISYPFFVAVFAWLFFRETQFNWPTVLGGVLILGGVGVVFWGNRS